MGKGAAIDVLVVGAGVYGLAAALALARAGRSVRVLDRLSPGSGASGGPVGALAPHAPDGWSERKALQRDALVAAEAYWRSVARESGLDPGYARPGRLMPLRTQAERARAEVRRAAAEAHWHSGSWRILSPEAAAAWLAPEACPAGAVFETLTARLAPQRAVAALAAAVAARGGELEAPAEVVAVEADGVVLADGRRLQAALVVVAAGSESDALLPGRVEGVKGQALVLEASRVSDLPVIGDRGLWIVPHADGTAAVGSTSERAWTALGPDERGDALLEKARALCPRLADAPVVERWAGIRPRAAAGEPVVGWVAPGVLLASGGYKTGFATAPVVADLVARLASGEAAGRPAGIGAP